MSQKERKAPRALVNIPLRFIFNDHSSTGVIKDISVTGVQCTKVESTSKLQFIEFELASSYKLKIEVSTVWTQNDRAGLRFKKISKRHAFVIKSIVRFHRE